MEKRLAKIIQFEERWLFLWIILWSIFLFIRKETMTNPQGYLLTSAYFLFSSVLIILIFKDYLKFVIPKKRSITPFIALLLSIALSFVIYYHLTINFQIPEEISFLMESTIKDHFSLQGNFIIHTFFEVLFQQTLIILLTGFFTIKMKLSMKKTLIYFLLVFGTLHLIGLSVSGVYGSIFLIASIFASLIFPYIIARIEYGFVYSYIIHFLFHTLIGPILWIYFILF